MRVTMSYLLKSFVVFTAVAICACGKKSKSSDVTISVQPSQPIVFTSDLSYQNGTTTVKIKAPWFKFGVSMNNTSDQPITIIGLHIEVSSTDSTGQTKTNSVDLDPSTSNYTVTTGGNTITCTYTDFGQFDVKGVPGGPSFNNTTLYSIPSAGSTTGCPIVAPTFYIGSNPIETDQTSFIYRVKVKPLGWFGTRNQPADRYEGTFTFSTQ